MNQLALDLQPEPSYRLIPLTQGQHAKVDPSDFDWLNQWKWRAQWNRCTRSFYAVRSELRKQVAMHRAIMDNPSGFQVDHRDRDTLNNVRRNLRKATRQQNAWNSPKRTGGATSKLKGVHWHKHNKAWFATISIGGKLKHLGQFQTEEEAREVYNKKATELHGDFFRI
jgi:hypothetical protein